MDEKTYIAGICNRNTKQFTMRFGETQKTPFNEERGFVYIKSFCSSLFFMPDF
ncbi:hypothetical protein GCM10009865_22500 [Aeromicrobium ponti]